MQKTQTNGEVIGFYGDVISMSEDAKHHYTSVNQEVLRDFVSENATQEHMTIMYPQIFSTTVDEMRDEITSINPHADFKQIGSMRQFMDYVETGSHEIDRELHPIDSIQMLNTHVYYDVIEREVPKVEEVVKEVPKEYVKAITIESNERTKLSEKMKIIAKMSPEDFVDYSGLKGFDINNENDRDMIGIVQLSAQKEFMQNYGLPSALQTTKDNIMTVAPGLGAKSIKDGLLDGVEFSYELLGDKDAGHLEIELDCETRGECHPKVHRVYEDTNKQEVEVNDKGGVVLEGNSTTYTNENNQSIHIDNEQNNIQKPERLVDTYLNEMKEQSTNVDSNYSDRTLSDDYGSMDADW